MSGGDEEFDDFLQRRRRLFDRRADDDLEPPAELDRLVLRQAREAIEPPKPQRVFRAPRWGLPVGLAATLVLAFSVILHMGKDPQVAQRAEVNVQNVAREISAAPAPAAAPAPMLAEEVAQDSAASAPPSAKGSIVVDIGDPAVRTEGRAAVPTQNAREAAQSADAQLSAYSAAPPAAPAERMAKSARADSIAPEFRRDARTWMAEIERLRASGDVARADAELAEYKRQHRAYAVAPDR